jgi:hypothetical protein
MLTEKTSAFIVNLSSLSPFTCPSVSIDILCMSVEMLREDRKSMALLLVSLKKSSTGERNGGKTEMMHRKEPLSALSCHGLLAALYAPNNLFSGGEGNGLALIPPK